MIPLRTFILLLLLPASAPFSQQVLDDYIRTGLKNNIVLKQKQITLEKAGYSLKIAASYFFPSVSLKADYTSGEGGRSISIPVGDLMNPVYSTLNQLTHTNAFPQISNVEQDFFPYKFYDVKLRASMPLVNTDIYFNKKINESKEKISGYELELYSRQLIREIKSAYYNYLSAVEAGKIYSAALELAAEGKRVNEKLLLNGLGLPVYILRSESEIEAVKAQISEAENNVSAAKKYFNFLLNRDQSADIISEELNIAIMKTPLSEKSYSRREELKMLAEAVDINRSLVSMNEFNWAPKINAFFDYGAQDQVWNMNSKSKYYLFGFMLELPLFESFRHSYQIEESELDLKIAELEVENISKKLELSESVSFGRLETANQNYFSALKQSETAEAYYRLILKGYREGINSFIETVDARTQLTQSRLLLNISKYKVLSSKAEYEHETSSAEINKFR